MNDSKPTLTSALGTRGPAIERTLLRILDALNDCEDKVAAGYALDLAPVFFSANDGYTLNTSASAPQKL